MVHNHRMFRFPCPYPRLSRLIVIVAVGLALCACSSLRYYAQAAEGHAALIVHRRPVSKLLRDPVTDPKLATRLRLALQARRFASRQLGLPDNRSYTGYVALDRPYVVWNVFAAPRFSVEAVPQCFPIAGCVAYRGWFDEAAARADAARLQARGDDAWIGGVPAYSTLGWFADPILSSMLRWDDDELAGTIFHELAHQLIYASGDTAFDESFATFVQHEGLRQWRLSRALPARDDSAQAIDAGFTRRVLDLRQRLKVLYASGADDARRWPRASVARSRRSAAVMPDGANASGRMIIATTAGWRGRSTMRGCCRSACTTAGRPRSRCCSGVPGAAGRRSMPACASWRTSRRPGVIVICRPCCLPAASL